MITEWGSISGSIDHLNDIFSMGLLSSILTQSRINYVEHSMSNKLLLLLLQTERKYFYKNSVPKTAFSQISKKDEGILIYKAEIHRHR